MFHAPICNELFLIFERDCKRFSSLLTSEKYAKKYAKQKRAATYKSYNSLIFKWAHLGSNQGPPDYESGALTS